MNAAYTRRDLLKLAMAGAVTPLSALTGATAPTGAMAESTDSQRLFAARARRYLDQILDVAKGPGGMIIAFLPFDTRRPFQEGEPLTPYLGHNLHRTWGTVSPRPTTAEWYYGENTLWATGWLLQSQMLRYRVSGEPEALATARKCFRDLTNIFRLSWTIEPGLLGKPHGGRAGPTTSYDQAACPVIFYAQYAEEFGTAEEKTEAKRYMAQHGGYYLRHKWVMNHHGHLQDIVKAGHTSLMKYLACEYAAYKITGDTRFRDEAFLHLRNLIKNHRLPLPPGLYEANHNLYYYSLLCEYWSRTEIGGEYDWIGCMREYWKAAKLTLDAEGMPRLGQYDPQAGTFAPYPTRWWPAEVQWQSGTLFGNGGLVPATIAALGLTVRAHGIDDEAHLVSERILRRMDDDSLRWFWGRDAQFPKEMEPVLNIFGAEIPAMWQVAYWLGRQQSVW